MLTAISPSTFSKRAMASASVLPSSTRRWISVRIAFSPGCEVCLSTTSMARKSGTPLRSRSAIWP